MPRKQSDATAVIYSIGWVIEGGESSQVSRDAAYAYLDKVVKNIICFNDAAGRTSSEVQAAFQKAADLARKEGQ